MPDDAYRFARGEQVTSNTGLPVKLERPYDFYMITDHSDAMGMITDLIAGAPNIMADRPVGRCTRPSGRAARWRCRRPSD